MAKKLGALKEKPTGPAMEEVQAWSSVPVESKRGKQAEETLNIKYLDNNNAKIQRENNDTNRAFDDEVPGLG